MKFQKCFLIDKPEGLYRVLKKMYLANAITKRLFYKYIDKKEGGQFYSTTLRRIFSETKDINVGIGTYGCFTDGFRPHVDIGAYCSIAPGVQRLVGNHPYTNASSHPIFYSKEFGCIAETRYDEHKLIIGNDVWIGVNAIITGNVEEIGDGAIIGAGAVVTHNVRPYEIVAGVPAKVIGQRFDDVIKEKLIKSAWWDLTPDRLAGCAQFANDIDRFIEEVEKQKDDVENDGKQKSNSL